MNKNTKEVVSAGINEQKGRPGSSLQDSQRVVELGRELDQSKISKARLLLNQGKINIDEFNAMVGTSR